MAKILVTGASGMVGRNILESDWARSHELLTPRSSELDLTDYSATEAYLLRHQPVLAVHCAGRVGGIAANMAEPVEFFVENMDMGRNLLMACKRASVTRVINLGSSCMYPRDRQEPLTEDMVLSGELEPTNEGYALAKIATARLAGYISSQFPELQYKTLIPCNLYGRWDDFDPARSHLVPAVIAKIHQAKETGAPSVEIWGDGEARREFMYAGDLADFIGLAIDKFAELPPVMNVGVGSDHSVNDYYRAAAEAIGWQGAWDHDLSKPVGMKRKLCDVSRQTALGWQPKTDLLDGMKMTYTFFQESH
jgi:GDP-L-fucose synthase